MWPFSGAFGPGPVEMHWQVCELRAEKSHPNVIGGNTGGRLRCGAATDCNRPCKPA